MVIPDYQNLMLPLLKILKDRQEHTLSEVLETLAHEFHLTDEDRKELLPSGKQAKFDNRVGWARTYLKKSGLLESTGRGKFCITQRGLEVLATNPEKVTKKLLEQFPEFQEFKNSLPLSPQLQVNESVILAQTPEELLELGYQSLQKQLAQEILNIVKNCSPRFFERIVVDLLIAMGYGGSREDAGHAVGQTGDGGIDGIIKEDRLGLDIIYIQAKRWESTVGRPIVQAFAGSLEGMRAKRGVLITTSKFSKEAYEYIKLIEKKIVLIDGDQLAELMIEYNTGVGEAERYIVKKIDYDYFNEEL
ncbi:restriction endonuclease [Iningainema sp. BLCCT55]|uniref:Restriction endonuclease n=2 Tax=Iningainema TaxID=1932705 RepID=A0A8J7CAB8_9CYAN|nr:restriction endonuclease [Iningainema tapete BLCC-T55]